MSGEVTLVEDMRCVAGAPGTYGEMARAAPLNPLLSSGFRTGTKGEGERDEDQDHEPETPVRMMPMVPMPAVPVVAPPKDSSEYRPDNSEYAADDSPDKSEQTADQSKDKSKQSAGESDPDWKGEYEDDDQ